jgi:hypothetical protein
MSGLKAALYKDLKLFFRRTGLAVLLLPLALLLALQFGLTDSGAQSYLQPFPVAVRDEDNTIMSRSLVAQMSRVQVFSQILRAEDGEGDAQLLERGAAAVVTIPEDFFYDLYSMEDCPVQVTLNRTMPLESSLFNSMFSSVMEIIRANQSSWRGLYEFRYGAQLTPEQQSALYAEASNSLIQDALGRLTMFADDEKAEAAGMVERKLLALLLAVIVLFFSLSTAKTLPEELALGVLPRFRAAGGSLAAFLCAKLLTALLSVFPTLLLTVLVLRSGRIGSLLLVGLILLAGAFGLLLAVAAWSGAPAAAQRWGNLLLLLSLVLGGGLWPRDLLPAPLALLGRWTLPHFGLLGVEAACRGMHAAGIFRLLWPVLLLGAAGFALALTGLRRRGGVRQIPVPSEAAADPPSPPPKGTVSRLVGMAAVKLRAMSGGYGGLALLLAGALLCGMTAASAQDGGAGRLRIAICDLDETTSSRELMELMIQQEKLSAAVCGEEKAQTLLLQGDVEGVLTIDPGYEQALQSGSGEPALRYAEANSSISATGVREIAAGQATVQRCRQRAIRLAGQRMDGPLNEEETARLLECISQAEADSSLLYNVQTADGAPLPDPFLPTPMGFAALCVLFTLFTAAPWSGAEGRRAARRLLSLPHGRLLACGSDCLALGILGFLTAAAVLLPCGAFSTLPAAAAYAFCSAALAQALTRFTAMEGRVDGFAPFLALFLCLLGGCFLDLSQLLPAFQTASLITPPGLALRAASGFLPAYAALLGQGALFLFIASPGRKHCG